MTKDSFVFAQYGVGLGDKDGARKMHDSLESHFNNGFEVHSWHVTPTPMQHPTQVNAMMMVFTYHFFLVPKKFQVPVLGEVSKVG